MLCSLTLDGFIDYTAIICGRVSGIHWEERTAQQKQLSTPYIHDVNTQYIGAIDFRA